MAAYRLDFRCDECEAIVRELMAARRRDLQEMRARLVGAASSSKRTLAQMRDAWLSSIAKMGDDELETVLKAHYPRVGEVRRRQAEHEAASGHSVHAIASAALLGYRRLPLPGSR